MTAAPILIGCAHGTREPAGQRVILDLLQAIQDRLGVEVREAYVDVQTPKVGAVVDAVVGETASGAAAPGRAGSDTDKPAALSAVVVPLLLAGGYHVYVDIARAVLNRPTVVAAPALGPDQRLIQIVLDRVHGAGIPDGTSLVLAAAGSSDPRSQADTEQAAALLRARWAGPVRIGYAAGITPTVTQAVTAARADAHGAPVAVASFLLSPGFFQRKVESAGGDHVTGPLAPHSLLVDIVADRYREACGA